MDNNKMTVYSNIITGQIVMVVGGIQDMSVFGDNENKSKELYSYILIDYNLDVLNNTHRYKVIENKLIKESEANV